MKKEALAGTDSDLLELTEGVSSVTFEKHVPDRCVHCNKKIDWTGVRYNHERYCSRECVKESCKHPERLYRAYIPDFVTCDDQWYEWTGMEGFRKDQADLFERGFGFGLTDIGIVGFTQTGPMYKDRHILENIAVAFIVTKDLQDIMRKGGMPDAEPSQLTLGKTYSGMKRTLSYLKEDEKELLVELARSGEIR